MDINIYIYIFIYIYIIFIYLWHMLPSLPSLPKHSHRGHRGADAPGPVQGHVRRGLLRGEAVRRHGLQGRISPKRSVGTTKSLWKSEKNEENPMNILKKVHENPMKILKIS